MRTCRRSGCLRGQRFVVNDHPFLGQPAMDAWEPFAVREHCRDAVRAWAELECKSPQMADDLIRRYRWPEARQRNWRLAIGVGVKLAAWVVESWWHITRR
jgi:hypothetical protein